MRIPFPGSVVLITGGASGVGRLLALGSARRGARAVVIWDIDEAGAQVAEEITTAGTEAHFSRVDLTDGEDVGRAAEETLAQVPGVDILINSAGVVTGRPFLELSDAEVTHTFEVNTFALYRVARQFLPGMIERGFGSITVIASAAGLIGVARQTDYSASKFAASGFTESLRAELRHAGASVRTLLVQPYYIDTGMFEGVTTRFPRLLPILGEDEVARTVLDAIAAGRQSLVMPPLVHLVKWVKILPAPLQDRVADAFGINATMDQFTGRATGRSSERATDRREPH